MAHELNRYRDIRGNLRIPTSVAFKYPADKEEAPF
jgi:hypothetical protein